MASTTETATMTRRYVELDAVETLLKNLDESFGLFDVVDRDDTLMSHNGVTSDDLGIALWPGGDFGETPAYKLASAESSARVARICAELQTDKGRAFLASLAKRHLVIAGEQIGEIRAALEVRGDDDA